MSATTRTSDPGHCLRSTVAYRALWVLVLLAGALEAMVLNSLVAGYASVGAKQMLAILLLLLGAALAFVDANRRLKCATVSFLVLSATGLLAALRLSDLARGAGTRVEAGPVLAVLGVQTVAATAIVLGTRRRWMQSSSGIGT